MVVLGKIKVLIMKVNQEECCAVVRGLQILFCAVPHSASTVYPTFATTISDFGFVAGFPESDSGVQGFFRSW